MSDILQLLEEKFDTITKNAASCVEEVGVVVCIGDGMARVYGLHKVAIGEVVEFDNGNKGVVSNLEIGYIDVMLLDADGVKDGSSVKRTFSALKVPVGQEMLGRVVDTLCRPLDDDGEIHCNEYRYVEISAPGVIDRQPVNEPLQTGIKAIDAMIPIGRGQRELIIGDRQTGKTTIAIDTILNQVEQNKKDEKNKVYCIYVAIGQKTSSISRIVNLFKQRGAMDYTVVVVASASSEASLQYYAPYVGCTIGEYFRDNGMHALVVYDDLTKHAIAYRQISLLLRKPPGREAYPGDIFYLHARLLERSAKLSDALGGGSLTALPIIETQDDDVSAYIPTNVISITDGQIFLDKALFYKGARPAINIGLSVSRVGSAAQTKAMRRVASKLKLELAQFRELEVFTKLSSDLDDSTVKALDTGNRISEILKQQQHYTLLFAEQVAIFFACHSGLINNVPIKDIASFEQKMLEYLNKYCKSTIDEIHNTGDLSKENMKSLHGAISLLLGLEEVQSN